MWRTGSTYLLSRFEAESRYLPFYEPFNGELSDRVLRRRAQQAFGSRHLELNHPASDAHYFAVFDRRDPATSLPLWHFSQPRLPIADVYNGLSDAGIRLLAAALRLADKESRRAVFGFCHSGVQIDAMMARFGGEHVYLSRAPREQFWSYRPGKNDFFMPATTLQLLASSRWRSVALALVPTLRARASVWTPLVSRTLPHRVAMRLGRWVAGELLMSEMYLLFYLSWLISHEAARASCDSVISLKTLHESHAAAASFEDRFALRLADLAPPHARQDDPDIDYALLEGRVALAVRLSGCYAPAGLDSNSR